MRSLISHPRHTVRLLTRTPGFTITAILILGLGIGANTAIFSLVNGVLLKPLPYPQPDRLVQLFQPFQGLNQIPLSYPDYLDFAGGQHSFDALTVSHQEDFNLSGRGVPERISGLYVSGSFFSVLGRPFLLGRPFGEAEERPDAPGVVVISEHLWRTQFNSDANILGTDLALNGKRFQVVGVTIKKIAAELDPNLPVYNVGLLGDQVANAFATERLASVVVGLFSGAALLLAAVGLYGVLSYSVLQRKREIGVRMALGAQSAAILNLVIKQGLTVVGIGLVIGLLGALALSRLISNLLYQVSGTDCVSIGLSVLILSLVSLIACLLPALRATRIDPLTALNE